LELIDGTGIGIHWGHWRFNSSAALALELISGISASLMSSNASATDEFQCLCL